MTPVSPHPRFRLLLVTALHGEAKPFIDALGLKRNAAVQAFETFEGNDTALVVSGVGKVRSAMATAAFLSSHPVDGLLAVNVGIAGASRESGRRIGDLLLIHRIRDAATSRELFPDMLVQTPIPEAPLVTVDRPVMQTESFGIPSELVDMEGSGFFEAAATLLPSHASACLKVVSDHLDGSHPKPREVTRLIGNRLPEIRIFLKGMTAMAAWDCSPMGAPEHRWMETVASALRLTVTQKGQLRGWVRRRLARHRPLPDSSALDLVPPGNKRERNLRFEQLRARLDAEA